MRKKILVMSFLVLMAGTADAENLILKSGRKVEGKILEKTDDYVKIDFNGVALKFYSDEIASVDQGPDIVPAEIQPMKEPKDISNELEVSSALKPEKKDELMETPAAPTSTPLKKLKPPAALNEVKTDETQSANPPQPSGQFKVFNEILADQQNQVDKIVDQQRQRIQETEQRLREYYEAP
jgi:hypothetical protein